MGGLWIRRTWQADGSVYAPARHRRACEYEVFLPDRLEGLDVMLDARLAGIVSDAEGAIRDLNAEARPALAPLGRLLLRTESIASSKVEGLEAGVRDLAKAEAGGRASATAVEVLANIDAMQLAVDAAVDAEMIGVDEIAAIHERLLAEANPRLAGRIRTRQNWIGGNDYTPCGADFVPPPPEEIADLLDDLTGAMNSESLPPLMQAALVHAQFETIHPFDDGNGRTGRALIHVLLRRRGLARDYVPPISVVLGARKERYVEGLTLFRENRIAEWLELFSAAAAQSAGLASQYLTAVGQLQEEWRAALAAGAAPRSDAAAWAIIDVLPAHPTITMPVAAAATGRARAAVHKAIDQLVSAGVLERLTSGMRYRVWEGRGLLDLLAGLEAGEPIRSRPR